MKMHFLILVMLLALSIVKPADAADMVIKDNAQFGCTSKKDYKDVIDLAAQNDQEAFSQLLGLGIATGVCVIFKAHEPVVVTKPGLMLVQVRRRGNPVEYWTSIESVQAQ